MRTLLAVCALIASASIAQVARADSPNLAALGLGGMKKMSQSQAQSVRGQGSIVWGGSFATLPGAFSTNGYLSQGRGFAIGGNISFATRNRTTVTQRTTFRGGNFEIPRPPVSTTVTRSTTTTVIAGGASAAISGGRFGF